MNSKPRIILADQDAVDTFDEGVRRLLAELGHPEALVTDESQISDFLTLFGDDADLLAQDQEVRARLSVVAGRPVARQDRVWEVARDIENHHQVPTTH